VRGGQQVRLVRHVDGKGEQAFKGIVERLALAMLGGLNATVGSARRLV
jgi:hypothetical protein